MAIYKVQGPDGQQHELEGPDGATDDQIIAKAQEAFGQQQPPQGLPAAVEADKVGLQDATVSDVVAAPFMVADAAGEVAADKLGAAGHPVAGATIGTALQMAPYIPAAVSGIKAAGPIGEAVTGKIGSIRNRIADFLKGKAETNYARATGLSTTNATDLIGKDYNADAVRAYGRKLHDEGVVGGYKSPETMLEGLGPRIKQTGKDIGDVRAMGEARNANPQYPASSPAPKPDEIIADAKDIYGEKYTEGIHAGEQASFERALKTVGKAPQTYPGAAQTATKLNAFANQQGKFQQPANATTDVANLVAHEADSGLSKILTGEEQQTYEGLKETHGVLSDARTALRKLTGKDAATGEILPMSKWGMVQKGLNVVAPAGARASAYDKVSNLLRTSPQAFGRNRDTLQRAAKAGKAAFASTIYMLQQQDPAFKAEFEEMNRQ